MAKNRSRAKDKKEANEFIEAELAILEQKRANISSELRKINFLPGTEMKNERQKQLIRKIKENQIIYINKASWCASIASFPSISFAGPALV